MHRCNGNSHGRCSCGLFHTPASSFSTLFSMPNNNEREEINYLGSLSSSSSSVDCTLSLGTPSTRRTADLSSAMHRRPSFSCMSNLSWDILQTKQPSSGSHKCGRGGSSNSNNNTSMLNNSLGGDALLARRCANCDTTSTPLWRNGPRGPKSLCNACGIRYKKEERRATSASGTSTGMIEQQLINHHQPWNYTGAQTQNNEFIYVEDDDGQTSDTGVPFLSWRLNVLT
ncbi:GATA transcription factor 18-like [Tasmannia lanceolata]|uniref:GATA transcription factor 18-like n=1 Tax=Tasmannia lanceolata TaxID=3420 RepID=UPI004064C7AD